MIRFKFLLLTILCLFSNAIMCQNIDTIQTQINQYISQAQLDSAKAYIQYNLDKLDQKKDKNELNYQLVKVLFMQSAYDAALQQAFNSVDDINNAKEKVKYNFMIGVIYSAISDYDKSIEYFDLVVQNDQNSSLTVQTYLLLSDLHLGKKDSINSKRAIDEAYNLTSRSNFDPKITDHVAMQYNYLNQNYEACKELNLKTIRDSTSFLNAKSYAYSMIGDCLIKQDSLKVATKYFEEFLNLTFQTKDPEQIKVAATKLIEVYEKLGNQETANTYHKIYNEAVNDSLSFSIEKYRDLYTIEKNRELNIAKTKNLRYYLIFGSIFLVLVSFGIYYYFKKIKSKKTPGKKIVINDNEIKKIATAIGKLRTEQLYLTANITRKSFCDDSDIKSERYLSQYINEEYKKSFSVFINDLRVEHAYKRIQNDSKFRNYKVEEIAKDCGFGSKKSFERAFIAKYNQTPYKLISSLKS